jgi:hypothetical protein
MKKKQVLDKHQSALQKHHIDQLDILLRLWDRIGLERTDPLSNSREEAVHDSWYEEPHESTRARLASSCCKGSDHKPEKHW